jgi:hypothetical protein
VPDRCPKLTSAWLQIEELQREGTEGAMWRSDLAHPAAVMCANSRTVDLGALQSLLVSRQSHAALESSAR